MSSTDCSPNFILVRLIFMNDFPKESSPFDFDDEQIGANGSVQSGGSRTFLRWSIILTAISFAVSLAGSVMGNNVTGDSQLESIAFTLNRFGMMAMLLGCIGIFAAFRWPSIAKSLAVNQQPDQKKWSTWWKLLIGSIVGTGGVIASLVALAFLTRGQGTIVLMYVIPLLPPFFLVMGIWNQGVLRAYWLGVGLCMFLGSRGGNQALLSYYLTAGSSYGYTSYQEPTVFGDMTAYYSLVSILIDIAQAVGAGLLCSGYVSLLESSQRRKSMGEAIASERADLLQNPLGGTTIDPMVPEKS